MPVTTPRANRPPNSQQNTGRTKQNGEMKPGLYANIHKKKKRIAAQKAAKRAGKNVKVERMRKPGTAGAPTAKAFKQSAKTAKKK